MKKPDAAFVRKNFPQCVAVADELRAVFGDDVKLMYLQEGGHELGNPGERGMNPCGRGDEFVVKQKNRGNDR